MKEHALYDLAFALRRAKPWKKLWDSNLFAVAHSDGATGYCCVMGRMGEHLALAAYPGDGGLRAYRRMSQGREGMDEPAMREAAFSQDCVMVSFQNKSDLSREEQDALAEYCRQRGIAPRGARAFPQFERFRPMHMPWTLSDGGDIAHMQEAMQAALEVARRLETADAQALGFTEGEPYARNIPLLTPRGDGFEWGCVPLPPPVPETHQAMEPTDDVTLARLKKAKAAGGDWSARVFLHAQAFSQETQDGQLAARPVQAPEYPLLLMVVDNRTGMVQGVEMARDNVAYAREFARGFADMLLRSGRPARILVPDARTLALLETFCGRVGIGLARKKTIPALNKAVTAFFRHFGEEEEEEAQPGDMMSRVTELVDKIARMPSLEGLPDDIVATLLSLPPNILPPALASRLKAEASQRGIATR